MYKVTGYDNRNGRLVSLEADVHGSSSDPERARKQAIDLLIQQMMPGGNVSHLCGIQFWTCGGITWYKECDEPVFQRPLSDDEIFSR
jgi:hypothetical protein